MKKYMAILCVCALALGIAACRRDETPDTADPPAANQPSAQPGADSPAERPDDPTAPIDPGTNQPIPEDPQAIAFFDCGKLDLPNTGDVTGRENFAEFLNLTGVGKEARIEITQYTKEGNPIVATLTFDGTAYTLQVDATADAFAAPENRTVTETTWQRLITQERRDDDTLSQMFRLTNLSDSEMTADTPDGDDVYTLFSERVAG